MSKEGKVPVVRVVQIMKPVETGDAWKAWEPVRYELEWWDGERWLPVPVVYRDVTGAEC